MPEPPADPVHVTVTDLGEYVRHRSCDRRFYLTVHSDEVRAALPVFDPLLNTIDPVLRRVGLAREDRWADELTAAGYRDLTAELPRGDRNQVAWADFAAALERLPAGTPAFARQVRVGGTIGAFRVTGDVDFVLVRWDGGRPRLWLIECKASRRDRTYHRVQVAAYRVLLRRMLGGRAIPVGGAVTPADAVECVVARIDEARNGNQSILALPPLDLAAEEADLERLLAPCGRLDRVLGRPEADIPFRLDDKCDGCVFGVHCLAEAARRRRPELLGLDPVTCRMLRDAGLDTLDKVADPPVFDDRVTALGRDPGFDELLATLRVRAKARRQTLPGGGPPDEFEVAPIPHTGAGHLPPHEAGGVRLVRVYLAVDYDYTENRVGALSAHVTRSDGRLHTGSEYDGGRWEPVPDVTEDVPTGRDDRGRPVYATGGPRRPVRGREVVEYRATPWSGTDYTADTADEQELIGRFFARLAEAVEAEAGEPTAPVHLYVWSRSEVGWLVEGCTRGGGGLLGSLRQLLGCRDGLDGEQLIYSCVQDEVRRRFALGWTGRGLAVAASLRWFGRRFHWRRRVGDRVLDLDREFAQNVFDFKTTLHLDAAGNWAEAGAGTPHTVEIRARFGDGLPAPYWHAVWGTLPDPAGETDPRVRGAVERYGRAAAPGVLAAYLAARCQALRWLEENVTPKNPDIHKPPLPVAGLTRFALGRDDVAAAAVDFLRLDQHVRKADWVAEHLMPPLARVPAGRTLPLRGVKVAGDRTTVTARVDLQGFGGLSLRDLEPRCAFAPGAFVRLSPWNGDPLRGQTVKQLTTAVGRTCVLTALDWRTGAVTLEAMYAEEDGYTLASGASRAAETLFGEGLATLDESVTDYVAGRVDRQLRDPYPVFAWFDPVRPAPPPAPPVPAGQLEVVRRVVTSFPLPPAGRPPQVDQARAVVDGLAARVQLLQGPPGTGKTTTTALSVLARALVSVRAGDIVLVAAHTHRAVDELLARLDRYADAFAGHAAAAGLRMPRVRPVKAHSGEPGGERIGGAVDELPVAALTTAKKIKELTEGAVLVLGGTTAGLLKLAQAKKPQSYNGGRGLVGSLLVVDEASMMVFPHFLALATLVDAGGRVMLAGDHRQLAPITAHDWETEDRPPVELYQPFASAYEAVRRVAAAVVPPHAPAGPSAAVVESKLRLTFRLPPAVRELIARVYRQDRIELAGPDREAVCGPAAGGFWGHVWRWNVGVFLVVHEEDRSKRSNPVELEVVNRLLAAAPPLGPRSVALITPHRAQRSLFRSRLAVPYGDGRAVDTIDTVERLQGGERPTVVVSATASDPAAIEAAAEFVLDLNRANVAFSRVQDRLVVVCARTLLDHIPSEVAQYQSTVLWKALRDLCSETVDETEVGGHRVRLYQPPPGMHSFTPGQPAPR